MSNRKILNIGLFGFGCVGQGLYNVLKNSTGIQANIVKIGVKNPNKKRSLDDAIFTYNKDEILDNHEINMIIELINNSKEAFEIVSKALLNGKDVVTANKKMIAEYFNELIDLQKKQVGRYYTKLRPVEVFLLFEHLRNITIMKLCTV